FFFFFSSRRRHTRSYGDWSSDVCSSDLLSPWLLLLLIAGIIPAFLGESHFAFLGYARNLRQTPIRRQLDYLRVLGGSREAAKERSEERRVGKECRSQWGRDE